MSQSDEAKARHLVLVLSDQLDGDAAVFDDFDRKPDAVDMMEVAEEASSITQHKIRLALFVSAVRHFGQDQVDKGVRVHYAAFEGSNNQGSFAEEIARWGHKSRPEKLIRSKPGDFRVEAGIVEAAKSVGSKLEILADPHFVRDIEDCRAYAEGRK